MDAINKYISQKLTIYVDRLKDKYKLGLHGLCHVPVTQALAVISALFTRDDLLHELMDKVYAFLDTKEQLSSYTCAKDYFEWTKPVEKYNVFPGQSLTCNIETVKATLDDMLGYDVNLFHCQLVCVDCSLHIEFKNGPKPGFCISSCWRKHVLQIDDDEYSHDAGDY